MLEFTELPNIFQYFSTDFCSKIGKKKICILIQMLNIEPSIISFNEIRLY